MQTNLMFQATFGVGTLDPLIRPQFGKCSLEIFQFVDQFQATKPTEPVNSSGFQWNQIKIYRHCRLENVFEMSLSQDCVYILIEMGGLIETVHFLISLCQLLSHSLNGIAYLIFFQSIIPKQMV